MHITTTRVAPWSRFSTLPANMSQAVIPFTRPDQLTSRELRRLVADMID
tara:strand:- start:3935 stop:4081 length:147 start_codon:yes stop_codon:yes gene_type:complete